MIIVGSHATPALFPQKNSDGDYISSDGDAMLKTVRLRFETHFDIHDQLILLDSTQTNCPGIFYQPLPISTLPNTGLHYCKS